MTATDSGKEQLWITVEALYDLSVFIDLTQLCSVALVNSERQLVRQVQLSFGRSIDGRQFALDLAYCVKRKSCGTGKATGGLHVYRRQRRTGREHEKKGVCFVCVSVSVIMCVVCVSECMCVCECVCECDNVRVVCVSVCVSVNVCVSVSVIMCVCECVCE